MIASHRDGEITFYEELGVARDASPEQIREAFRLYVRLLHPDRHADPQLKEFAEIQMRKLNRIHAVLSNPESRRRYDETLDEDYDPPVVFGPPSPALIRLATRAAWTAGIALTAGVLIWMASAYQPAAPVRASDPAAVAAPGSAPPAPRKAAATPAIALRDRAAVSERILQLQADLKAATVERDAAIGELNRLRGASQPPGIAGPPPGDSTATRAALTITELPSTPKLAELPGSAPPRAEKQPRREFAGFWFYARPVEGQNNKNRALYPPEYIEATITESGGTIHGSFRSRFQIADRLISPDVDFTFTGVANGSQITCPWTGAAGAKGDVTLRLVSDTSMRIDWVANDLGSQQGLASGTAVLTRRIE